MKAMKERRYIEADRLFRGRNLTSLLEKAETQHELMLLTGRSDTYEVEAIYDVQAGEWAVQLHDCAHGIGRSLYSRN